MSEKRVLRLGVHEIHRALRLRADVFVTAMTVDSGVLVVWLESENFSTPEPRVITIEEVRD